MTDATYQDRQDYSMSTWSELRTSFQDMTDVIKSGTQLSAQLKREIFTIASAAGGCRHCQSHGAYGLHKDGVEQERILALWTFDSSDLFNEAERAAFHFTMAAAQHPNVACPEHFNELRKYYTAPQVVEMIAVLSRAAFLNRWHDTVGTVTDAESADWAAEALGTVGWEGSKHKGSEAEEQPSPWGS